MMYITYENAVDCAAAAQIIWRHYVKRFAPEGLVWSGERQEFVPVESLQESELSPYGTVVPGKRAGVLVHDPETEGPTLQWDIAKQIMTGYAIVWPDWATPELESEVPQGYTITAEIEEVVP